MISKLWVNAIMLANLSVQENVLAVGVNEEWSFVSIPDYLNADVVFPEPRWDDALFCTLNAIKAESPDFVLVAGDMVNGRWWRSPTQLDYMADRSCCAWIR